mmetsp:Transcript_27094/g.49934  ORF Transcript_27094/g.49934 Transcript_27094/m.49934 type:complete len:210 (-) Transcript_27094:628-1257(-)
MSQDCASNETVKGDGGEEGRGDGEGGEGDRDEMTGRPSASRVMLKEGGDTDDEEEEEEEDKTAERSTWMLRSLLINGAFEMVRIRTANLAAPALAAAKAPRLPAAAKSLSASSAALTNTTSFGFLATTTKLRAAATRDESIPGMPTARRASSSPSGDGKEGRREEGEGEEEEEEEAAKRTRRRSETQGSRIDASREFKAIWARAVSAPF